MKLLRSIAIISMGALLTTGAMAAEDDVIESEGMKVFGNDNSPDEMIDIPWKAQLPDAKLDGFVFSVPEDVFKPLDRKIFLRQISYYNQVFPKPVAINK